MKEFFINNILTFEPVLHTFYHVSKCCVVGISDGMCLWCFLNVPYSVLSSP